MLVLDTDCFTLWLRGESAEAERLQQRLDQVPAREKAVTVISFEEQTRGWLAYIKRASTPAQEVEAYRRLRRHLNDYLAIQVMEFDENASQELQRLKQSRLRVGSMDLRIAAIAIANDATLLARNLRDFRKVPGLKVEDWTI
jgi:tRNA(fMet)-specific endonuclease VapC